MDTEVELFRKFLQDRGYPPMLIPVECACVSLQAKGTATRIMKNVIIVEEHLNGRREASSK